MSGEKEETVLKTIGIKLNLASDQSKELEQLFEAFKKGINWTLHEIEKRYQNFLSAFQPLPDTMTGICFGCNEEKKLRFMGTGDSKKYCAGCAMKMYSEYTVRKEVYGTGERTVENDLKDIIDIPNKTHYSMLFSQAYSMWKSYNAWNNKRLYEKERLEQELKEYPDSLLLDTAYELIAKKADIKRFHPKTHWKDVKRLAEIQVFKGFTDDEQKEIKRLYENVMELKRLKKPIHFPQLEECRTIMMSSGFVKWDNRSLYLTLWQRKPQQIDYFGRKYLEAPLTSKCTECGRLSTTGGLCEKCKEEKKDGQNEEQKEKTPLNRMELDNKAYCNLTKKSGEYYLMYPLELKVTQPPDLKDCDTFVVMFSPSKIGVFSYDKDGCMNSVNWFHCGELLFAKRHFKEKRGEIASRKFPEEKARKIRKRNKKIRRQGGIERRFVSTFNHQVTHEVIACITELSDNPKIVIWDVGNGVTQNFGRHLNYLKNLWPAVQQQEYLKHKAKQISIPTIEMKYNECNDLICSSCGAKQMNGKKPIKVITQFIKGCKNFKCEKCKYEVNMLINQANNVKDLCRSL